MKILFVSDLDGTLIGDSQALESLNQYIQQQRENIEIVVAYSTGRSKEKYLELKNTEPLETPDFLITGVGTQIYKQDNFNDQLTNWPNNLPNWDRATILSKIMDCDNSISLQEETEQLPFKISFYGQVGNNYDELVRNTIDLYPQVDILISHNGEYIDILPKGINKAGAVKYLQNLVKPNKVICAGDSLNDYSMLKENNAIIPKNGYEELTDKEYINPCFIANRKYAEGVKEGLIYYLEKYAI
jgi:sucrose-6F-phosphate phosphohydrolase